MKYLQLLMPLAAELQGALSVIALGSHVCLTSAHLNDMDGVTGYAQQLYGYGRQGDVFLGISTSGNSKNVMYAAVTAKAKRMEIVALTGVDKLH